MEPVVAPPVRWWSAWPDLLAFAASLAMAWYFQWRTTDLVWSLWLSSFSVGYAMIVWTIFGPGVSLGLQVLRDGGASGEAKAGILALGGAAYLVGGLLLLAFFTFHFGMFHVIHSIFLNLFFPAVPIKGALGVQQYLLIAGRYWYYVPLAALAERQAFRLPAATGPADTSVKAADIAARKSRLGQAGMMGPYKNVVRMHLLIFFFAFAHFMQLDNFGVYAVVFAVYFFPWRLLKRAPAGSA
jgi:hypothetical protein